jgi:hypothetical protein
MRIFCELCDWAGEAILEHIHVMHPDYVEHFVRWPDGDIVIFDEHPIDSDFTAED